MNLRNGRDSMSRKMLHLLPIKEPTTAPRPAVQFSHNALA